MQCIFCDSKDLSINENVCYCNSFHKTMIKDKAHKYSLSLNDKKSVKSYREELDKAIKMNLQKEIINSSKKYVWSITVLSRGNKLASYAVFIAHSSFSTPIVYHK